MRISTPTQNGRSEVGYACSTIRRLISASLAVAFVLFYLSGQAAVPFHPDESTHLYMSRDFATLFLRRDLTPFAWDPHQPLTRAAKYRLLDAPISRYLIGLAWWLSGDSVGNLNGDWDWNQTWEANAQAGHLPARRLLLIARIPSAVLGALTAVLMFRVGASVRGVWVGLLAALFLGLNPLMLLHTRRAMAEAPMLFFSLVTIWASVDQAHTEDQRSAYDWRAALGGATLGAAAGLAAASKHSATALAPVALLGVGLAIWQRPWPFVHRLVTLAGVWLAIGLGSGLVFVALNPITYSDPLSASAMMIKARAEFARAQIKTSQALFPGASLLTATDRFRAALLEVYLRPPAVWDIPIYLDQLAPQAEVYFEQPLSRQSPLVGAVLAGLSTAGLAASAVRIARDRLSPAYRGEQMIWLWGAATLGLTLLAIPLDWQRYFLPLLPLACLFAALGVETLTVPLVRRLPPAFS